MKLRQVNEELLLERELKQINVDDTSLSSEVKNIVELEQDWKKAYEAAKSGGGGQALYVVYVEYLPTKKQQKKAAKEGGGFERESDQQTMRGYLQLKEDKKVDVKLLKWNFGDDLFDVVDSSGNIVKEGTFNLLRTPEGATPYNEVDANALVKKLKAGFGSGIKVARTEKASRKDIGKHGSEKDLVVDMFLESVLGADALAKTKKEGFNDLLARVAVETEFNEKDPLLTFVGDFLSKRDLNRSGYIILHNLYANGELKRQDLIDTYLTPLLKSDLLINRPRKDVESVIASFKDLYNSYNRFNRKAIYKIFKERLGDGKAKSFMRSVDENGYIKDSGKKTFANTIIYVPGKEEDTIERGVEILNIMTEIKTGVESQPIKRKPKKKSPAPKAPGEETKADTDTEGPKFTVPNVPDSIEQDDIDKYSRILKDVSEADLPKMFAYLKSKGWIK